MYIVTEKQLEILKNNGGNSDLFKNIESSKLDSEVHIIKTLDDFTEQLGVWGVKANMNISIEVEEVLSHVWYDEEMDFEYIYMDKKTTHVRDGMYYLTKKNNYSEIIYSVDLDILKSELKRIVDDNDEIILFNF